MKAYVQTFLFVFITAIVNAHDRKVTSQLHPGCETCTQSDILMYIRAEGSKDTIHQIWDFTQGIPTVILAVAGTNTTLDINWIGKTPVKFNISEKPKYSFAIAIDKLYEYDDVHDNGYMDDTSPRRALYLRQTEWALADLVQTSDQVMVMAKGWLTYGDVSGMIDVKLDFLPYKDCAVELPHLIHTSNSTLLDIRLVNFTNDYNATRYAARAVLVSSDPTNDTMHYAMRKSLDDEHTPGVFEIIEIKSPESFRHGDGGFLQFRPVAYTERERNVATSTYMHVSPLSKMRVPEHGTLGAFYRAWPRAGLLAEGLSVSFGDSGDGFYRQSNYTAWSLTVGYGSPPLESFSTFVIVIISIGLGVPVCLALSGVAYALGRRARARPRPAHARFTDDD